MRTVEEEQAMAETRGFIFPYREGRGDREERNNENGNDGNNNGDNNGENGDDIGDGSMGKVRVPQCSLKR